MTILIALFFVLALSFTQSSANDVFAAKRLIERLKNQTTGQASLSKTINSKRVRILFVAGLEGTGHHGWKLIFGHCITNGSCQGAVNLTQSFMKFDGKQQTMRGLFGAEDARTHSIHVHNVYKSMEALAKTRKDRIYIVGLESAAYAGMMSYPNYNGKNKPLDHPDIFVMAALAELAGLDLRVLILQRSAKEILASNDHRNIGGAVEPHIMVDNAAALYSQMLLMDHSFYHCMQFRELGALTPQQKESLATFIHPTLVPPIIDQMLSAVHYSENSVHKQMNITEESSLHYHEWLLERRLHLIDSLCHRGQRQRSDSGVLRH